MTTPHAPRGPPFLVALDPGTRRAGVAVYDLHHVPPDAVRAVDLLTSRASVRGMLDEVAIALVDVDPEDAVLVSEWPRKYRTSKAAWADLDGLRVVVTSVEGWGWAATYRVAPGTWKGQVPKHIHHARVAAALDSDARARIGWDALGPDARDAVALGRWAVLGPQRARFAAHPTPETP